MVVRVSGRLRIGVDGEELRERTQCLLHCSRKSRIRRCNSSSRSFRRIDIRIEYGTEAEVSRRNLVLVEKVCSDSHVTAANVTGLKSDATRQLALDSQTPAHGVAIFPINLLH